MKWKWQDATKTKPAKFGKVLLALINRDLTTGHYVPEHDHWVGFAGNQSPPYYVIADGVVTHWCEIEEPGEVIEE